MDDESGDDNGDDHELTSEWGGQSRHDWRGWRKKSGSWFERRGDAFWMSDLWFWWASSYVSFLTKVIFLNFWWCLSFTSFLLKISSSFWSCCLLTTGYSTSIWIAQFLFIAVATIHHAFDYGCASLCTCHVADWLYRTERNAGERLALRWLQDADTCHARQRRLYWPATWRVDRPGNHTPPTITPQHIVTRADMGEGLPGLHPHAKFYRRDFKNVSLQPPKSQKLVIFGIYLLQRPLPTVSRSRHSLTLNISETVLHTDILT